MKLRVNGWVLPICIGNKQTVAPKIYEKRGYAVSGGKALLRRLNSSRTPTFVKVYDPVELTGEVEFPECDVCDARFRCFTNK